MTPSQSRREHMGSYKDRQTPDANRSSTRGIGIIETGAVDAPVSVSNEIARLETMDIESLLLRWRAVVGSDAPAQIPRSLVVAILAYRLQANTAGDLDFETASLLDRMADEHGKRGITGNSTTPSLSGLGLPDQRRGRLKPGSVLVREHAGVTHHVMVMADGFSWNGEMYSSLSKVALAITGTSWNGPRFFGIDRPAPSPTMRVSVAQAEVRP